MIPKNLRLKTVSDFAYIAKKGQIYRTKNFSLKYLFVSNVSNLPKIGIVVSAKKEKKSTRRNLLKRQIRMIISSVMSEIKPNTKAFIQVQGPVFRPPIPFTELKSEILFLLKPILQ